MPRRIAALGALITAVLAAGLLGGSSSALATDPVMHFDASSYNDYSAWPLGSFVTVTVLVDSDVDFAEYAFDMPYDHDLLQVFSYTPTSCLNNLSTVFYNMDYGMVGGVSVGCGTTGPYVGAGDDITLLEITFQCVNNGSTSLSIDSPYMVDRNLDDLYATAGSDATVTCDDY